MPGIHERDESDLRSDDERDERSDLADRAGQSREERDDEADDDREHRVARRPNPLPSREEDEEDLAEADILEELDLGDGPDA